jgi:hypothetical protein
MNRLRSFSWSAVAALILLAGSPAAFACTACFGQSDSNMAKGMNMGIAVLLLIITCVLSGVAGFFVFLAKRSAQLNNPQLPTQLSQSRTNA